MLISPWTQWLTCLLFPREQRVKARRNNKELLTEQANYLLKYLDFSRCKTSAVSSSPYPFTPLSFHPLTPSPHHPFTFSHSHPLTIILSYPFTPSFSRPLSL